MIEWGEVFGIPVIHDSRMSGFAQAMGIWPFKRIVIGRAMMKLDRRTQWALVMHEAKHCLALHQEIRCLLLPFFWTQWARRLTHHQEMAADAFAVDHGYGVDFVRLLSRLGEHDEDADPFHPSHAARVANIMRLLREREYAGLAA